MGMTVQRKRDMRVASFDRDCKPCLPDDTNLGEERRYYEGGMFVPVKSVIYPGHEQPYHRHDQTVEWVIVLEGQIDFIEGNRTVTAHAGDAVLFTPSATEFHTMANTSPHLARYLTVKSPIHSVPMDVMTADRFLPEETN